MPSIVAALEIDPLLVFPPMTLDELVGKAELMEREDHKYVIGNDRVMAALAENADCFHILEIDGRRSFTYENHYFDSADLSSFYEHKQGKRKRFKVRTRHYVDSDICFLELKLKGPRERTIKSRIPYEVSQREALDARAMAFIKQEYEAAYGRSFDYELQHSLTTTYQRTTLVSSQEAERITIDSQLVFGDEDDHYRLDPDTAIVETKSVRRKRVGDKVIGAIAQHPISRCSKYCVGLALLGKVERHNPFNQAIRKLI